MGVSPVQITAPQANDLLRGEFKAYINYGLPTQKFLGVCDGGGEVKIMRELLEIMHDGSYGITLDSDGVPIVRFRRITPQMVLNLLYLKYFQKKIISDCESDGTWESKDWAATGGTYAAETTIVNSGSQSAKMTAATSQHGIHEIFASSKSLAAFDNSEVSGTGDYIGFAIYIASQDKTDLGSTAKLRLTLHNDAELTETNGFYYDVAGSALTAGRWNTFKIAKSAFTEAGTGSWSAVTGVSLKLSAAPDAEVVCYIDSIDLIQNKSKSEIVPLNAGNFDYTDQTTYRLITPDIEITEDDYLENITLITEKKDGKMWKVIVKNAFNDGEISLAYKEFTQVVNASTFTGHYRRGAETTVPIEIYEYTA